MPRCLRVCAVHELPPGRRRVVEIDDVEEALVLNLDGTIYAVSNICPHEGAALQRGPIADAVLYCPLHRWGFDLRTGAYVENAAICVRTYRVERHGNALFLCLP